MFIKNLFERASQQMLIVIFTLTVAYVSSIDVKAQMPAHSTGDNISEAAEYLYKNVRDKLGKSQFETEKEYLARLEKLTAAAKYKDKTLNKLMFIVEPCYKYDAEKNVFTVYIREECFDSRMYNQKPSGLRLLLKNNQTGSSARYVTADKSSVEFPMRAAAAREAARDLRLAITGLPIESLSPAMFNFAISKVVVFNIETGKIYKEFAAPNIKYSSN